jgi:hypothetical protein
MINATWTEFGAFLLPLGFTAGGHRNEAGI